MNNPRIAQIRSRLEAAFSPDALDVVDESHRHTGHAGARDGRGHFFVKIISSRFEGVKPLARHRMVYAALGTLMQTDIHALSLEALSPTESR